MNKLLFLIGLWLSLYLFIALFLIWNETDKTKIRKLRAVAAFLTTIITFFTGAFI